MGALARARLRTRRLLPRAGTFAALLLAYAVVFPAPSEARVFGLQLVDVQLGVRRDCSIGVSGRSWIRGVAPCKEQIATPALLPPAVTISGKMGLALAADLYCRMATTDLSEFTNKEIGCLPHPSPPQRLIVAKNNDLAEWPAGRFGPAPDTGMIEAFSVGRLPDG
jgi:hypothetical protein